MRAPRRCQDTVDQGRYLIRMAYHVSSHRNSLPTGSHYTFKTTTALLRPEELRDKELFTGEEVAAQEQVVIERNLALLHAPAERAVAGGNIVACDNSWLDPGTRPSRRTSLIVDSPSGRLLASTPGPS